LADRGEGERERERARGRGERGGSDGGSEVPRRAADRGHLVRVRHRVRGHQLAAHLPHHELQVPALHHRPHAEEDRRHEAHHRSDAAGHQGQGQEDGPLRALAQGVQPRPLAVQVQVRRRRRRRAHRRLQPPLQPLRGQGRRQAALLAHPARAEDVAPRIARRRCHRLLHGVPLLPLLRQHPLQFAEAVRVFSSPGGCRPRPVCDPRAEDEVTFVPGIVLIGQKE
jgi:hypothetical protein